MAIVVAPRSTQPMSDPLHIQGTAMHRALPRVDRRARRARICQIARVAVGVVSLASTLPACLSAEPEGLARAQPAATTVKFDFLHTPLPEIPLPNDIATRADLTSATGLRVNASILAAATQHERRVRELIDQVDGWGTLQQINIPFTGPLDIGSILDRHRDPDYEVSNDAIYLINVDADSPELGRVHHLDVGNGNYPSTLEQPHGYGPNDPRGDSLSLLFEEAAEDRNGDGVLQPEEDTDADGVLDVPNYLPGAHPAQDDLGARADALMSFYERETNTLIAVPLVPLRERTTYAVVVTRRLLDEAGNPVGSPFEWIHHLSQTEALRKLPEVLQPLSLSLDDVAFAFTYTTQSIEGPWKAVRDGLYGHGVQSHLADIAPAEVTELLPLRDAPSFPDKKLYLMTGEDWVAGLQGIDRATGGDGYSDRDDELQVIQGQHYVDFYVMGSFQSPQLLPRVDQHGNLLGYNDQSWPPDLDIAPAQARPERIVFTLAVPRKEVSVRGEGKPAPIIIMSHGHGSSRFEVMMWAAYLAKHGFALLSIDCVSHGVGISEVETQIIAGVLADSGLANALYSVIDGRAIDQNADGVPDSGADFWTAYMFHTRDVVRQSALDIMQLIRVFKGFDGEQRWNVDTDLDHVPDLAGLAGDFDGDGVIDVDGTGPFAMTGGSLGGIMTMVMGSLEPEIRTIMPVVGGGALATIGIRSTNGGAKVGFMIRSMTPAYVGTLDETGAMAIDTYVPDLLDDVQIPIATLTGIQPGDTFVVENIANGQRGCGLVTPEGAVHAPVASDAGDPTTLSFYRGAVVIPGSECEVAAGAELVASTDKLGTEVEFQGKTFPAGSSIVALTEGFGFRRGSPSLRRMQGLAQLVLDPGDPGVLAPHIQQEPLHYEGTGQTTGAHALMVFTEGDTSVPNSAGMVVARAAGLLEYLKPDPRYGKPHNQLLIDTYIAEGVHNLKRYVDVNGAGVHIDIEGFSGNDDIWTPLGLPRLDPPLRIGLDKLDVLGGKSAALFVLSDKEGDHGFGEPGQMLAGARQSCADMCTETEGEDPCGCRTLQVYDVANFMVGMMGRYAVSGGTVIGTDLCQSHNDCPDVPGYLEPRPADQRP